MGNHLIGDTKYGKGNINRQFREDYNLQRLFLHCIGLKLTSFGRDFEFTAPLPFDLNGVVEKLGFRNVSSSNVFGNEFDELPTFSKRLS